MLKRLVLFIMIMNARNTDGICGPCVGNVSRCEPPVQGGVLPCGFYVLYGQPEVDNHNAKLSCAMGATVVVFTESTCVVTCARWTPCSTIGGEEKTTTKSTKTIVGPMMIIPKTPTGSDSASKGMSGVVSTILAATLPFLIISGLIVIATIWWRCGQRLAPRGRSVRLLNRKRIGGDEESVGGDDGSSGENLVEEVKDEEIAGGSGGGGMVVANVDETGGVHEEKEIFPYAEDEVKPPTPAVTRKQAKMSAKGAAATSSV